MFNLRSVILGFVAGTIPGIAALSLGMAFTGLGNIGRHSIMIEVVGPSLVFAAIGGTLGAMTSTSIAFIRARRRETTTGGKRYRVAEGLVAGMVPGLSGLIYAILFLGCGDLEPGSFIRLECRDLRSLYLLVFTAVTVIGALLGSLAGGYLAVKRAQLT